VTGQEEPKDKLEGEPTEPTPRRDCSLCGGRLWHKRRDARFCSDSHRAEASRFRRLLAGEIVDECESLAEYLARRHGRTSLPWEPQQESVGQGA
jgi:hypothetical protein